ncbi:MAG: FHA domain-containing protein, partial [Candidatus Wallbacteria bacterium]|nr:FHA domain-containing protein [Candidatus Wallbacteria bacterium]
MARLRITKNGVPVQLFAFDRDVVTIGAGPGTDVVLTGDGVAPRHATLRESGGAWEVTALEAGAPLRVNGVPAARQRMAAGDVFDIGPYRLELESAEAPAPRPVSGQRPAARRPET